MFNLNNKPLIINLLIINTMKKIFVLFALATVCLWSCNKDDKGKNNRNREEVEEEYVMPIKIDGDVADWAKLDASKVAIAKTKNENWPAVKEIRCYADEFYVFYYIEFDSATAKELLAAANGTNDKGEALELPIRLNINTDGEFTSGYTSYSLDGYDFIMEGGLAQDGAWKNFTPNMYQRIDGWQILSPSEDGGLTEGAGKDNHYEIALSIAAFNAKASGSTVPMPMGSTFQTGIRFYTPDWGELSNMPNDVISESNEKGYGHLLNVTIDK